MRNVSKQSNAITNIRMEIQKHTESIQTICVGLSDHLFSSVERGFNYGLIEDEIMLHELTKSTEQLRSLATELSVSEIKSDSS